MATPLRREDVAKVAKLARLRLSDDELDMFTEQLGNVLEHANDIAALDLDDVVRDRPSLRTDQRGARRRAHSRACRSTMSSLWRPTPKTGASQCRASWERRREKRAEQIVRDVKSGETSAVAEVERSLDAIRARNEELNVFVHVDEEDSHAIARRVDERVAKGEDPGSLAGVPIALKDNLCRIGVPTTAGSRILEGWKPPYSATVVDLLLNAGAVPVGTTNMDEFAMGSSTETSYYGPTRNPHDPSRVPGGSSGGSAAAVAAGMTPICARLGHGRVDSSARSALWDRRRQAHVRPRLALWTHRLCEFARPDRPLRDQRR